MNIVFPKNTNWFKAALYVAGVYHVLWGLSVIVFPCFWFDLADLSHPNYVQLWQFIGLYEVIFGIGYLMAASNPLRHWRVVLLGFVSKLCVVIGFTYFYSIGQGPLVVFNMILSNHIFWLIPFLAILYNAYRHQYLLDNEMMHLNSLELPDLLSLYETNKGNNLLSLSQSQPVMLVFLRHFGCVFCKETLSCINQYKQEISNKGTKLVLVHMSDEISAMQSFEKFKLQDVEFVTDPELMLYKGFKLKRGTLLQVLGLKVWIRTIYLFFSKRIFSTIQEGSNVFQMPGVFLIQDGEICKKFVHQSTADVPPYLELLTVENSHN